MIVDLPEPGGADDEDELALLDHEGDPVERGHAGLVDLAGRPASTIIDAPLAAGPPFAGVGIGLGGSGSATAVGRCRHV